MELNSQEIRDSWIWFIGAGFLAICLSVFLYSADNILTYSDKEERLGQTLKELRTAQHTVSSKLNGSRLVAVPVKPGK